MGIVKIVARWRASEVWEIEKKKIVGIRYLPGGRRQKLLHPEEHGLLSSPFVTSRDMPDPYATKT